MEELVVSTGRRIVATLPAGTPLLAAVDALCARHDVTEGDVRIRGALKDVHVSIAGGEPLFLSGVVQVVSGEGTLAPDLGITGFDAVVAWSDRGLPRLAAGCIDKAESAGVRVSIEVWSAASVAPEPRSNRTAERPPRDASPPRAAAEPTTPPSAPKPAPAPGVAPSARATPAARPATSPAPAPEAPPATAGGGWAAAVAASRSAPPAPSRPGVTQNGAGPLDEDPEAKVGDVLVHPQFGRCKVVGNTEGERVKIRMATGRFVDLHLGYVKLVRQADEDGVRVFRVQPNKR